MQTKCVPEIIVPKIKFFEKNWDLKIQKCLEVFSNFLEYFKIFELFLFVNLGEDE